MPTAAASVLKTHWNGKVPVDVGSIARALGIRVQPNPMMTESGIIEILSGKPVISYSSTEAPVRQRFTVAHEIGHFALGHLSGGETKFRDPASNFSAKSSSPEEREANIFAAQLLMPPEVLKYAINEKKIRNVEKLATIFGVSQVAMKFRLMNLGYISG